MIRKAGIVLLMVMGVLLIRMLITIHLPERTSLPELIFGPPDSYAAVDVPLGVWLLFNIFCLACIALIGYVSWIICSGIWDWAVKRFK